MALRGILDHRLYIVILFKLFFLFFVMNFFIFLFHNEILVSMFGFPITQGEMKSLTRKQWVNGVVM